MKEGEKIKGGPFDGFEVISVYTRAQAIEDGFLVDVTEIAKEAGFKYPVAITRALWDGFISPDEKLEAMGQSVDGRLWDVLWMLRTEIRKVNGSTVRFGVLFFLSTPDYKSVRRVVILKAVCGPGDEGEPVITIMLPEED